MAEKLRLSVYVIGLDTRSFSVIIENSKTVDELKDAILMKKSNVLKDVDADQLTLYKVELPDGENLEQSAPQALREELKVSSYELSEVFPVKPPAKTVSILLDIKDITTSGATPLPYVDTLCPRTETVKDLYEALEQEHLVHVRGTPGSGKTTLMFLLDAHIRRENPSAFVYRIYSWTPTTSFPDLEARLWAIDHHYLGRSDPAFLLFDDAQYTYDDEFLWSQFLKHVADHANYYRVVVFCSYGSPTARPVNTKRGTAPVLRVAARMTLWPRKKDDGREANGLLLDWQEFNDIVERRSCEELLKIHCDLLQLIFHWTTGHVAAIVDLLNLVLNRMKSRMQRGEVITVETFNKEFSVNDILGCLKAGAFTCGLPSHGDLLDAGVTKVFRRLLKDGTIPVQLNDDPAVLTCHRRGWIYAKEQTLMHRHILLYSFSTPLHSVALSWMLDPTDDMPHFPSLLQLSIDVISKFKPSQLSRPSRRIGSGFRERPPEAQYQDEFYRCLLAVTRGNVCISPEFATAQRAREAGRIDFFIPIVQWGIELTRHGDRLNEHASRFGVNGAYGQWLNDSDMEAHILLDCRTARVRDPHPSTECFAVWRPT